MSFIGNTPTQQSFTAAVDVFSGNGSTTAFTLSRPVATVAQVEAFIENVPQSPVDAFTVNGNTITFTSAPPSGSSNIYVRYTSPITQVIQPSDGSVGLNTLSSAVMSAIGGMGFKNRIINGAMMIDQRNAGASVTPTANGTYTLDRFAAYLSVASKYSVQQNAGAVTPPVGFRNYLGVTSLSAYTVGASEDFSIRHLIEGYNIADLAQGTASASTFTLSFQVYSSLTGTFGGSLLNNTGLSYPFSYTVSAANTWTTVNITVAGSTSGTWNNTTSAGLVVTFSLGTGSTYRAAAGSWQSGVYLAPSSSVSIVGTNGATFYITGVQLEKGSTATAYDYRPYGTELALCQRYLPVVTGDYAGVSNTSTAGSVSVSFPVSARVTPTGLIKVGTLSQALNGSGSGVATTSVTFNRGGTESAMVSLTTAGSLTAGHGMLLMLQGDSLQFTGCEL